MTKNEKLNKLKDLRDYYDKEIAHIDEEINTQDENFKEYAKSVMQDSNKRDVVMFFTAGALSLSTLVSLFSIAALHGNIVSWIIMASLMSMSGINAAIQAKRSDKIYKKAEELNELSAKNTAKIKQLKHDRETLYIKKEKAKLMINNLTKELYGNNQQKQQTIQNNVAKIEEIELSK